MTLPPDDDRLIEFMRIHRPQTPPASPELEAQVMAAVQRTQQLPTKQHYRRPWRLPALAASLFLTWSGWVMLRPPSPSETELATVNEFLVATWHDTAFGDETYRLAFDTTESSWFLSVYATPY